MAGGQKMTNTSKCGLTVLGAQCSDEHVALRSVVTVVRFDVQRASQSLYYMPIYLLVHACYVYSPMLTAAASFTLFQTTTNTTTLTATTIIITTTTATTTIIVIVIVIITNHPPRN